MAKHSANFVSHNSPNSNCCRSLLRSSHRIFYAVRYALRPLSCASQCARWWPADAWAQSCVSSVVIFCSTLSTHWYRPLKLISTITKNLFDSSTPAPPLDLNLLCIARMYAWALGWANTKAKITKTGRPGDTAFGWVGSGHLGFGIRIEASKCSVHTFASTRQLLLERCTMKIYFSSNYIIQYLCPFPDLSELHVVHLCPADTGRMHPSITFPFHTTPLSTPTVSQRSMFDAQSPTSEVKSSIYSYIIINTYSDVAGTSVGPLLVPMSLVQGIKLI